MQGSVRPTTLTNVSQKGKEKLHDSRIQESSTIFDVDGESSGSKQSLDEELCITTIRTPGAKKAQLVRKVPRSYQRPRRSGRHRVPVQILTYDSYVDCHYAYMAKIVQVVEPWKTRMGIGYG